MIRILIVDDEKPICDLIEMNLEDAGYECESVQDGLKAIDLIERNNYDLVLLDVMLPGADGFDIMEYIRPLKVPVIFITAKSEVKDRVKGLRLGADDYLVKPFEGDGAYRQSGGGASQISQNRKVFPGRGRSCGCGGQREWWKRPESRLN